jgi:hypothetical protein
MNGKYSILAIFGALLLFVVSMGNALAYNPPPRAGKWDFTVQTRYLDGQHIDGNGGSSADVNNTLGWGFGIGYNLTNNFELGMDIGWASANYRGTYVTDTGTTGSLNGTMDTSTIALNFSYYFTKSAVSPFIMGGIGSTFIDSNIPNGPPSSGCWYDPLWGYMCNTYQPTYSTTNFTYNAGIGLRWDVAPGFYLRGIIGEQWVDGNSSTIDVTNYRIDFGFTFR